MKFLDDNLLTFTENLTADHLGLGIEALYRVKIGDHRKDAISAILHGFCALESAVNFIGYELFWNQESDRYIDKIKRDKPLVRLLKAWNSSLPCVEKIEYLFSIKNKEISSKLKNELLELNNLRNWLSHGFSYKSTWLIEPDKDDNTKGTVLDYEYNIDWGKKFPNMKFNPINELNYDDAKKGLEVILEILKKLSVLFNQPFHLVTYIDKPNCKIIHKNTDIEDILEITAPNKN